MRKRYKLLVRQLDEKLEPFKRAEKVIIPPKGWINTVRTALNMTMAQLGNKLNLARQGVYKIEESERKGTISINSLKEADNGNMIPLIEFAQK